MNSSPRPVRVFLDSSDYSTLSDPARRTPELEGVLGRLLQFRDSDCARFYFSASVISEMAPIREAHYAFAKDRFQLLEDLCDGNALLWHEDLLRSEFECAFRGNGPLSRDSCVGIWWPTSMVPQNLDLFEGMSREHRRRTVKDIRTLLRRGQFPGGLDTLSLPPGVKRALLQHAVQEISDDQLNQSFVRGLSRPTAFLQYLLSTNKACEQFSEIVRLSSASMCEAVLTLIKATQEIRKIEQEAEEASSVINARQWRATGEWGLMNVFASLAEHLVPDASRQLTLTDVESGAPGFTTMIRTAYSAIWSSAQAQPRMPKQSDFVDALHASYAPYVDIFRTDQFMTPHVKNAVSRYGTEVVGRLSALPGAIDRRLNSDRFHKLCLP